MWVRVNILNLRANVQTNKAQRIMYEAKLTYVTPLHLWRATVWLNSLKKDSFWFSGGIIRKMLELKLKGPTVWEISEANFKYMSFNEYHEDNIINDKDIKTSPKVIDGIEVLAYDNPRSVLVTVHM